MRAWMILSTICCLYVITTQHQASGAGGAGAKIMGGQDVSAATTYPFMASLTQKYKRRGRESFGFKCGAAIISDQWILTAAHCVSEMKGKSVRPGSPSDYQVNVGSHIRSAASPKTLSRIIIHPEYLGNFAYDIALVKLASPLTLTAGSSINSAPLAGATDEATSHNPCTIMGWGKTSSTSSPQNILMEAQTHALDDGACRYELVPWDISPVDVTCVRNFNLQTGVCSGDSGSPLICGGKIYGVASFASSQCFTTTVSGYTDSTIYYDWITSNAN